MVCGSAEIVKQQVDEARLKTPPALVGRPEDGTPELLGRHRTDEGLMILEDAPKSLEIGTVMVEISPKRNDYLDY